MVFANCVNRDQYFVNGMLITYKEIVINENGRFMM